jgi:hypothetical protein
MRLSLLGDPGSQINSEKLFKQSLREILANIELRVWHSKPSKPVIIMTGVLSSRRIPEEKNKHLPELEACP